MLVPLGFSTNDTFLSLGSKLFPFQGPGQQATPLSSPPPLRSDCSPPPRQPLHLVGGSASANQRAHVQKALKALLWWRGLCKMAAAVRSVKVDCSVPLTFVFMQARTERAGTREERSVLGEKGPAYPRVVLRWLGSIGE